MNKIICMAAALLLQVSIVSAQSKFDQWPEMKAYDELLGKTYQPAVDGDLKPIRNLSHELLADIKLVTASPIPVTCDHDKMKKALAHLQKETDKLNAFVVRQEQGPTIVKQLNIVRDVFNDVTALCAKSEK